MRGDNDPVIKEKLPNMKNNNIPGCTRRSIPAIFISHTYLLKNILRFNVLFLPFGYLLGY
jgi:hypothetical protein